MELGQVEVLHYTKYLETCECVEADLTTARAPDVQAPRSTKSLGVLPEHVRIPIMGILFLCECTWRPFCGHTCVFIHSPCSPVTLKEEAIAQPNWNLSTSCHEGQEES